MRLTDIGRATGHREATEAALRRHVDQLDIDDNLNRAPIVPAWALWLAAAILAPFAAAFVAGAAS